MFLCVTILTMLAAAAAIAVGTTAYLACHGVDPVLVGTGSTAMAAIMALTFWSALLITSPKPEKQNKHTRELRNLRLGHPEDWTDDIYLDTHDDDLYDGNPVVIDNWAFWAARGRRTGKVIVCWHKNKTGKHETARNLYWQTLPDYGPLEIDTPADAPEVIVEEVDDGIVIDRA